jgi:hypothetical protein
VSFGGIVNGGVGRVSFGGIVNGGVSRVSFGSTVNGGVGGQSFGSIVNGRVGRQSFGSIVNGRVGMVSFGRGLFLQPHPEFLLRLLFGRGERPLGHSRPLGGTIDFLIGVVTSQDDVVAFVFPTRSLSEQSVVDFLEEPGELGRSQPSASPVF